MSNFTNALLVTPFPDGKRWVIVSEFGYDIGHKGSDDNIVVEQGFMTDLATVPRPLWCFLPRWGKYGNAAVIHDWLYWLQDRTRKASDDVMLEAMGVLEVPGWKRYLIYWAVRAFGWWAWMRNDMHRKDGHTRINHIDQIEYSDELKHPTVIRRLWEKIRKRK